MATEKLQNDFDNGKLILTNKLKNKKNLKKLRNIFHMRQKLMVTQIICIQVVLNKP